MRCGYTARWRRCLTKRPHEASPRGAANGVSTRRLHETPSVACRPALACLLGRATFARTMLHAKRRIRPVPLDGALPDVVHLIDTYFNAYNAARLRESCHVFARMIDSGATIGVSLSGALTPAGLSSVITPLIRAGFIDYISSTGANLYHDLHFDLALPLYRGMPDVASGAHDVKLREEGIIRVYDVLFPADVLYKTDEWVYRVMMAPEFGKRMSGSELHHKIGKYALETARQRGVDKPSDLGRLSRSGRARLGRLPGGFDHRPELFSDSHRRSRSRSARRSRRRRHGDVGAGAGRQAHEEGPVGRADLRRRRAQELPAANRAAAAGDLGRRRERGTTSSSRSPTRAPTPAGCRARRPARPCRGARSIPTSSRTPSSATWIRRSRCR